MSHTDALPGLAPKFPPPMILLDLAIDELVSRVMSWCKLVTQGAGATGAQLFWKDMAFNLVENLKLPAVRGAAGSRKETQEVR
eukprot:998517-Amphidinium_carterae.4